MTRVDLARIAARLALALSVLITLVWIFSPAIDQAVLSLIRAVLEMLVGDIGTLRLDIGAQQLQRRFVAELVADRWVVLQGQVIPGGVRLRATFPTYPVVVPLLIVVAANLAWPGLTWRQRLARITISMPLLVLLFVLDTPVVLAIELYDSIANFEAATGGMVSTWGGIWVRFMDGGGRYALAIAVALFAAVIHQRFEHAAAAPSGTNRRSAKRIGKFVKNAIKTNT